jgi:hypothetical protein
MLGRILCLLGRHRWYYKASYGWCERRCGRHASLGKPDPFVWTYFQGDKKL